MNNPMIPTYSIVAQWLECSVVSREVASSNLVGTAKRKNKPIGGGRSLENC